MSLRARLLLAVGTVALVALVTADVVTYTQLRSFLYDRCDGDLQRSASFIEQSLPMSHNAGDAGNGGSPGSPPQGQPSPNGVLVCAELISPSGKVLEVLSECRVGENASDAYLPALPSSIAGLSTGHDGQSSAYLTTSSTRAGGPTFRVMAQELPSDDLLVVAEPIDDVVATLHALVLVETFVSTGALMIAAVLGWWLVRRGLRPLIAMERTAESIAEGDLDERVPGANDRTEIGRLARTLNMMLGRIQHAFAQRDATEADLRSSEERLRRFVADASHELRTPLAAVSAYAELFERGASGKPDDLERLLSGIRAETKRMGALVEDLLLLARLDEGIPLAHDPVELVSLVSDAIRTAEAVGPDWPTRLIATRPVEVLGDGGRLRQVIDNLLSNVRSHTPGGTLATVKVGISGPEGSESHDRSEVQHAVLEVRDNGPGLTEEDASKVFERFFRTDTSRSRSHGGASQGGTGHGGAGLGLSIAASIVAAHGGSVRASPAAGGGAVFTVRLPVSPNPMRCRPLDDGLPTVIQRWPASTSS